MAAAIIDGKEISTRLLTQLEEQLARLDEEGITPGLAVVLAGEDAASRVYVHSIERVGEKLGVCVEVHERAADVSEAEMVALIEELGARPDVDGILVQSPLPAHLNVQRIAAAIPPSKDVDAMHPQSMGRVLRGDPLFAPCAAGGIIELLEQSGIELEGKECVLVGCSGLVGKPLSMLLVSRFGTVTLCHSRTAELKALCQRADILITATGRARHITADYIKQGAVVIDVGTSCDEQGRLCGDVDFEEVRQVAGAITPVRGGVGPMTVTMLMQNVVRAASGGE